MPAASHTLTLLARGLAAALGLAALANTAFSLLAPASFLDQNIWWIDCRPVPSWLANPILAVSGILLLSYAARPRMANSRQRATLAALGLLMAASVWNTVAYYGLLALGVISTTTPFPLSIAVVCLLAFLSWAVLRSDTGPHRFPRNRLIRLSLMALAFTAVATLFPLAQMFTFGLTDYRRPADAIIVLGAAVWPGNIPSHALHDRVSTGVALYDQGLAPILIFSGGPSDTPDIIHEVQAMRLLALQAGVPDSAIILDPDGINTAHTAQNCSRLFANHNIATALTVSHFYHLPRIKMAFQRQGLTVYTVPAHETRILLKLPYYLAREIAALWYYYFSTTETVPQADRPGSEL